MTATAEQQTRIAPPQYREARRERVSGPNPLLVVVAAFAVGVALAKVVDWMGHGHPRR